MKMAECSPLWGSVNLSICDKKIRALAVARALAIS
jgi:hypothetical protein